MAKKSILGEFMQSSAGKKLGFDNHIMNIHYTKICLLYTSPSPRD